MFIASLQYSTGLAASLALTNEFLIRCVLFVVRETRFSPKMSITFGAGDSDVGEGARRPSNTITAGLVTVVCGFTRARFVTRFTHKSLRQRELYTHDLVIVPFDIVIE
jgi:hypothetical protein